MNKYSSEAQKVISEAESLAFKFCHSLIGSEHLLLALLKEENIFSREVRKYHLDFETIYKKVKDLYPSHSDGPLYMEYTLELRSILDSASSISRQYREENISLYSLIVALLLAENTMAYEILKKMKVDVRGLNQYIQGKMAKKSELDSLTDLHNLASLDKDPLIGRNDELKQLINALSRRNKPNAILIGEPGVGKTAIVEELASLLAKGEVPSLKNKSIYELDLASTVGGTKYRGEFEEKVKRILRKVIDDGNCILFIDEIHNLIKAGGAEGAIDASNIIKPYLSRGQIQLIGATTEDEFQTIFEKDKALKRRFQVIKIEPTSADATKEILHKLSPIYQNYYHLRINDELLDYIVDLSSNLLPNYFFPDKAIDILDNSCVISKKELTKNNIEKTIESYYKVRVNSCNKKEIVLDLIRNNIIGQETLIKHLDNDLTLIENDIIDKDKPLLNLLFLGPSGVGKTESAKIIGQTYFSKDNIIYLDMSSYQESSALIKLIGINYGYNGQEINPKLVRELKAHPKSLIILDEIEKANNEVLDFFLGIMDQGYFDSSKGEKIDCRSSMIIMTSNFGYDASLSFKKRITNVDLDQEYLISLLQKRFRFEFLSRLDDIIVFDYLNKDQRKVIAEKYLANFKNYSIENIEQILTHSEDDYAKFGARLIKKEVKNALREKILQK